LSVRVDDREAAGSDVTVKNPKATISAVRLIEVSPSASGSKVTRTPSTETAIEERPLLRSIHRTAATGRSH